MSKPAPTTNRLRRSGVPFVPSHKAQPEGIEVVLPCQMQIVPDGIVETLPWEDSIQPIQL